MTRPDPQYQGDPHVVAYSHPDGPLLGFVGTLAWTGPRRSAWHDERTNELVEIDHTAMRACHPIDGVQLTDAEVRELLGEEPC